LMRQQLVHAALERASALPSLRQLALQATALLN
jgi:hypothetical protein